MRYLFGDSEIAAQRLDLVASTFRASSGEFLTEMVSQPPDLAMDLGCGPGHSTKMLAEAVGAARTVGLDSSDRFIAMARERASDSIAFYLHDFSAIPFPEGPAGVLYSRFELTHFPQPKDLISAWATQLADVGLLVLEEVEWIRTGEPTFTIYLGIVESLMGSLSSKLYVGESLERLGEPPGLKKIETKVRRVPVQARTAAMMFLLNLWSWRDQPFIRETYPPDFIEQLEMSLQELTEELFVEEGGLRVEETGIEWGIRQIAFRGEEQ